MLANWLDNPIFVKHVRSRLRRQPTMAAVSLMYVTCLCILFAGFQLGFLYSGGYFATIFLVQCIVLVGVARRGYRSRSSSPERRGFSPSTGCRR